MSDLRIGERDGRESLTCRSVPYLLGPGWAQHFVPWNFLIMSSKEPFGQAHLPMQSAICITEAFKIL